jgi:hypothetical protein
MRNFAWASFSVSLVLASACLPARSEDSDADMRSRNVDEKLFEWCMSQFPKREGEDAKPMPRPAGKLRPFDLTNAIAPSHLVTKTEVIGELPPLIEKYRGLWTWPAVDESPPAVIFVERLTATEMTIAPAVKRDKKLRDETDYQVERTTLSWTGTHFSHSKVTPEESRQVEILVSQSGEAMLMISGYSRKIVLEGPNGIETGPPSAKPGRPVLSPASIIRSDNARLASTFDPAAPSIGHRQRNADESRS